MAPVSYPSIFLPFLLSGTTFVCPAMCKTPVSLQINKTSVSLLNEFYKQQEMYKKISLFSSVTHLLSVTNPVICSDIKRVQHL